MCRLVYIEQWRSAGCGQHRDSHIRRSFQRAGGRHADCERRRSAQGDRSYHLHDRRVGKQQPGRAEQHQQWPECGAPVHRGRWPRLPGNSSSTAGQVVSIESPSHARCKVSTVASLFSTVTPCCTLSGYNQVLLTHETYCCNTSDIMKPRRIFQIVLLVLYRFVCFWLRVLD